MQQDHNSDPDENIEYHLTVDGSVIEIEAKENLVGAIWRSWSNMLLDPTQHYGDLVGVLHHERRRMARSEPDFLR